MHVDAFTQDDTRAQKTDAGDHLGRNPRRIARLTMAENTTKPQEPRATSALVRKPAIF
jgi:hypothetical protein